MNESGIMAQRPIGNISAIPWGPLVENTEFDERWKITWNTEICDEDSIYISCQVYSVSIIETVALTKGQSLHQCSGRISSTRMYILPLLFLFSSNIKPFVTTRQTTKQFLPVANHYRICPKSETMVEM